MRVVLQSLALLTVVLPRAAQAHSSDQAFVLLLPTGIYSAAGVSVVVVTMLVLAALPRLFEPAGEQKAPPAAPVSRVGGLIASIGLALLVLIGFLGPSGPLDNLLPLVIWTPWWICLPVVQPLIDVWRWINPWGWLPGKGRLVLPPALGRWPAVILFIAFALYQLAAIAPDDPRGLAIVVALYWLFTTLACWLFGAEAWLDRGEPFTIFFRALAGLLRHPAEAAWPVTTGVFYLTVLAAGSFDGLNETFWWLSILGINPLEFPGRSAVVGHTSLGLIAAVFLLTGLFAVSAVLGRRLAGTGQPGAMAVFGALALSVLPIALGYHVAHFLPALLVQGQYVLTALSDPLGRGWDLLGLGDHFVTTGFFYAQGSVRLIWLAQAGAVVAAHVWAVILAHRLALGVVPNPRTAVLLLIPLSVLMVVYTVFGLWLLAAPRGA